jgi:hypothetical protein
MAWRGLIAQPIGLSGAGSFSVLAVFYDDADPANATAGLGAAKSGTAAASTNLISITNHGFAAGDQVVVASITGGAGLQAGDLVTVISAGLTTAVFGVTRSPAGASGSAVDITTNATAITVQKVTQPANSLWSEAFDMSASSSTQDLIDEVTRKGQVARTRVQARDGARAAVLVGANIAIP